MRARPISCCFSGHRPGKLPWGDDEGDRRCLALKERLWNAMEAAYERGYRHFICGMAQGCDLYFCELALALRQLHGDVTVEAAIPCPSQAEGWPAEQRLRWQRLVAACDYETMVQQQYSPGCMQRRVHGGSRLAADRRTRRASRRNPAHHRIRPATGHRHCGYPGGIGKSVGRRRASHAFLILRSVDLCSVT